MRSSYLAAALALVAAPAPSAEAVTSLRGMGLSGRADCPDTPLLYKANRGQKARVSKLADLPPGNAYFAVFRVENGCHVPVMAGYGYGSTTRQRPATPRR